MCPCVQIKFSIHIEQVQLIFQTEFFVTLFLGTMRPSRLKLGTHREQWADVSCTAIRLLLLTCPIISSFFFVSSFQHWNILSHFSRELWGLEDWNLVHTWTVGRCIMFTRMRLLLRIHPFICSFFFLSNFQPWIFFVTLFSGTVRPRKLKLGTHVDSGQMYHVYQNQAAAAYSTLYFFIFLFLQFSTLKFFITLFSGTVRPRRLKLDTHIDSGHMYLLYWNQAATAYSFLCFFNFLSPQFSNVKVFRHTFLRNCEA